MKKIFTLFSLLMLTVVAMAADLTTGVTFKGTWADIENAYTPVEGEMTVTRTDKGLKFEVKSNGLNNYASLHTLSTTSWRCLTQDTSTTATILSAKRPAMLPLKARR